MDFGCFSQILDALLLVKVATLATKGTQEIYAVLLLDLHATAESSKRVYLPNSKYLLI
jgi:hypothetical protein